MTNSLTHFEIYGERPADLAAFYRTVLGWEVEQMPGVDYWRINPGQGDGGTLHGGLTYRAIPGLTGWMFYVNVSSLDETVSKVQQGGGSIVRPKTAVPRVAWVTIVADPQNNIFGLWQEDSTAFPLPEPD
jgi:uncharacterized protein